MAQGRIASQPLSDLDCLRLLALATSTPTEDAGRYLVTAVDGAPLGSFDDVATAVRCADVHRGVIVDRERRVRFSRRQVTRLAIAASALELAASLKGAA